MLWILAYPKCHNFYSREARVFRQRHLVVLFSSTSLWVWWLHILTADIVRCYYQSLSRKLVFVFTLSIPRKLFWWEWTRAKKTEEKTEKDISFLKDERVWLLLLKISIPIKPGRALEVLHKIKSSSRQFAI